MSCPAILLYQLGAAGEAVQHARRRGGGGHALEQERVGADAVQQQREPGFARELYVQLEDLELASARDRDAATSEVEPALADGDKPRRSHGEVLDKQVANGGNCAIVQIPKPVWVDPNSSVNPHRWLVRSEVGGDVRELGPGRGTHARDQDIVNTG